MSTKISAHPTVTHTGVTGTDVILVNASGTTSKMTLTELIDYLDAYLQPIDSDLTTLAGLGIGSVATTAGGLLTLNAVSAVRYVQINADGTATLLSASGLRTALSAQPLDSDLTAVATGTPGGSVTQAGLSFLFQPLPSAIGFVRCSAAGTVDTLTYAATAAILRSAILPPTQNRSTGSGGSTVAPNFDASDMVIVTALSGTLVMDPPTGSMVDGSRLLVRIKDNGGGARTLTWSTSAGGYRGGTAALPTTQNSKTTYVELVYNSDDSKWDCMATNQI